MLLAQHCGSFAITDVLRIEHSALIDQGDDVTSFPNIQIRVPYN